MVRRSTGLILLTTAGVLAIEAAIGAARAASKHLGQAAGGFFIAAHPTLYQNFTTDVITPWLRSYKDAGLTWVNMNFDNVTLSDPAHLAFLDQSVSTAKSMGLKLVLRFGLPLRERTTPVSTIISEALHTLPTMVARYNPDFVVVLFEPSVWQTLLGNSLPASQWIQYAGELAAASKSASKAPTGISGNPDISSLETDFLNGAIQLADIDGMGAHLYGTNAYSTFQDQLWPFASSLGKFPFVDEGWRGETGGSPGNDFVTANEAADAAFMPTLASFAILNGARFLTPFWTNAFYYYAPAPETSTSLFSNTNLACIAGQRTQAYDAYKSLV